jgi:hypothetical protein
MRATRHGANMSRGTEGPRHRVAARPSWRTRMSDLYRSEDQPSRRTRHAGGSFRRRYVAPAAMLSGLLGSGILVW